MINRFVAAFVALTLVVVVSLEVPLAVNFADQREDEAFVALERDAFGLGFTLEETLEGEDAGGLTSAQQVAETYSARTGTRVLIVDGAGLALADTDAPASAGDPIGRSFATRPEIASALAGSTVVGSRESETLGERLLYVAVPIRSSDEVLGAIRLSRSRSALDDEIRSYWLRLVAIALVTLAVAAFTGWLLGRWASRPLDRLRERARAFGAGDLDARATPDSGPPEVRELAAQFNRTAERLAGALRTTSQFASDAAHQLRTPLTALRLRIDNLTDDGIADHRLDPVIAEIERMDHTIDVLLALVRLDERPPALASIDLHEVLATAATTWRDQAGEGGVEIDHVTGAPVTVHADADHLAQVLDNLLDNALAVAPAGSTVELRAGVDERGPLLAVVDHGPGMSAEARGRARERHWSQQHGGSGLGLAIVDRLCRHNDAELVLDETPGGGLTAAVRFSGGDGPDPAASVSGGR